MEEKEQVMTHPPIDRILEVREKTHGDFDEVAALAQSLKRIMQDALHVHPMHPPAFREAVDMICTKLARIANGDAREPDHWHDIAGYATLAARSCHIIHEE